MPVQRLGEEGPVLREADRVLPGTHAFAEGQHGEIRVRQYDQATQPEQRRCEQQTQCQLSVPALVDAAASSIGSRRSGTRREAHRARGIETEQRFFPAASSPRTARSAAGRCEIHGGCAPPAAAPPNSRRRTARSAPLPSGAVDPAGSAAALRERMATSGRTNTSTASPAPMPPLLERPHHPAVRGGRPRRWRHRCACGPADDAVVRADESGHEGCLRPVVQVLRRAQLLEASVAHHSDVIGQHQALRIDRG